MLTPPLQDCQGLVQSSPHNICPQKQFIDLERIMHWEREYTHQLEKAREAKDFRAFSLSSDANPGLHLSWASQYRSAIDNLYRVFFCDWAPAGTAQPPAQYSAPHSSQLAELTIKLMALCPLPLTPDEARKAHQELEQSERRLMGKQVALIELDAYTQRERSIDSETFLKKYNIWVKRFGLLEDIKKIKQDIVFDKATLSSRKAKDRTASR